MDAYRMPKPHQPRWYCTHWAGPCWGDPGLADCRRDGLKICKARAENGCSHHERVPSVDDDGWAPMALARPKPPECRPFDDRAALAIARRLDQAAAQVQGTRRPPA